MHEAWMIRTEMEARRVMDWKCWLCGCRVRERCSLGCYQAGKLCASCYQWVRYS